MEPVTTVVWLDSLEYSNFRSLSLCLKQITERQQQDEAPVAARRSCTLHVIPNDDVAAQLKSQVPRCDVLVFFVSFVIIEVDRVQLTDIWSFLFTCSCHALCC